MSKAQAQELSDIGDRLFAKRAEAGLDNMWQDIADNFCPERGDFTSTRTQTSIIPSSLSTGVPLLIARDLANQVNAMLRPRGRHWFKPAPQDERLADKPGTIKVMDWVAEKMRRSMYDADTLFMRATKMGDKDFVIFGQTVLTVEADLSVNSLLFRNWHLRDCAWAEDHRGKIDTIYRKFTLSARNIFRKYPEKCPARIKTLAESKDNPHQEFELLYIVMPYDEYHGAINPEHRGGAKPRFMCLTVVKDDFAVLDEHAVEDHAYVIPRWHMFGSQYAHSLATIVTLPDARLLQRMTGTLIEAGEKAVNPPMLAAAGAIRSDINIFAGGITEFDMDYDEKTGEALRTLPMDHNGLRFGMEMAQKYEDVIKHGFYLNQIMLPAVEKAMTATEIRVRTEEFVRAALPLFEPMEQEYNSALCEKIFNVMYRHGAFGSHEDLPEELHHADIKWTFESPLADAAKREDQVSFKEAAELVAIGGQMDPSLLQEYDSRAHFRKAMLSIGAPMVDEEEAEAKRQQAAEMQQAQAMASMVHQGAVAGEQVGKAGKAIGDGAQSLMTPPAQPEQVAA